MQEVDVHHTKCKKAILRLTSAEAEKLAKSVAKSNVAKSHAVAAADAGAGNKSPKTVEDDGVLMLDSDTSQEDPSQVSVAPPDPVTDVTDQSRDSTLEDGTMNVIKEELLTEVKQEAGSLNLKSLKLGSPKKAKREKVSTNKIASPSPDIQSKGFSSPTNVRSNRLTIQDYKLPSYLYPRPGEFNLGKLWVKNGRITVRSAHLLLEAPCVMQM